MRAHAIKEYKTILQVLNEPGCPLCTFLKNMQSRLLQECQAEQLEDLCNAHAWALAAVRRTSSAAQVFLSMVESRWKRSPKDCSVCLRLAQEEIFRMRELISGLEQRRIATWLDAKGALCLPHGLGMRDQASGAPLQLINKMLERRRSEVEIALKTFVVSEENAGLQQGGALGRAAEFLVAQRGIGLRLNCCESPIGRQST